MGPPPQPSDAQRRRSDRLAAQATFNAVVIQAPSSHSSSSRSSRKRKRSDDALSYTTSNPIPSEPSTAATVFSVATKNAIIRLSGDECWHCGSNDDLECAHVLRHLQTLGRTNLANLHQKENGIRLCALCHPSFDNAELPAWVFVPSNLDFFINFERADFSRRQAEYKTSCDFPARRCPPVEDYLEDSGGLYDAYMLRKHGNQYSNWHPGRSTYLAHSKAWHGDPMIAIFKGFKALGGHGLLLPQKLWILSDLYQRNDLGPQELATDPGPHSRGESPDHHLRTAEESSRPPTPGPSPDNRTNADGNPPGTRQSGAQGQRRHNINGTKRHHNQQAEKDPEPKRIKVETSPWVWGPRKSSKDHAQYHNFIRGKMQEWKRQGNAENFPKPVLAQLPSPEVSEVSAPVGFRLDGAASRKVLDWLSGTKLMRYR
ncbi:MAG: hypothetical protein LQ338_006679 [Usnochroma carphineum]|nr:MAG: hypothetical protein LQ338_006679 [Usnochroma carphineum]